MRYFLPAALVVTLDQLTKQFFWRNGQNYDIVNGYLHITLVKNAGAAFGMFQGGRVFFIVASVAAVFLISWVAVRLPREDRLRRVFLGLILGGAAGNLIDRALHGEVIDFIQIGIHGHFWPVFNVADMAVTIGAVVLAVLAVRTPRTHSQPGVAETPLAGDEHASGR